MSNFLVPCPSCSEFRGHIDRILYAAKGRWCNDVTVLAVVANGSSSCEGGKLKDLHIFCKLCGSTGVVPSDEARKMLELMDWRDNQSDAAKGGPA